MECIYGKEIFQIKDWNNVDCILDTVIDFHKHINLPPHHETLNSFIYACLEPSIKKRATLIQLLAHPFLLGLNVNSSLVQTWVVWPKLTYPEWTWDGELLYYFWKLMGDSIDALVKNDTQIHSIDTLPNLILVSNDKINPLQFTNANRFSQLYSQESISIPLDSVYNHLEMLEMDVATCKIRDLYQDDWKYVSDWTSESLIQIWQDMNHKIPFKLNMMVKESNVSYQYHRIRLFYHLLSIYPSSRNEILNESVRDIPPVMCFLIGYLLEGD